MPLQHEVIDLRSKIIPNLFKNTNEMVSNLNQNQINKIKHFLKHKPFKILQCDKNVGSILINKTDELELATKHLNSLETYEMVNENEFTNIFNTINQEMDSLFEGKHIPKEIFEKLKLDKIEDYTAGKFRILPKIHKNLFDIRPIINCSKHLTRKMCFLVHLMINKHVQSIDHILKDSQQLLQIFENFKTNGEKLFLYTGDFSSLYTSMIPIHVVDTVSTYLFNETRILSEFKTTIYGIRKILFLIFICNIFKYNSNFYIQKIGQPMGIICGPSIANLYLFILERKWMSLNPDVIYLRFIDDTFTATKREIDLNDFKSQFLYLKLNIESGNCVIFLDLEITFNSITSKVEFSLYVKPTNTFGYLLPTSNHPSHIFSNIALSLFKRIRKICTSIINYFYHGRRLCIQLTKRNYNINMLLGMLRNVAKIDRKSLLPYKTYDNNFLNKNSLFIFLTFDCNFYYLRSCLYNYFSLISNNYISLKNKKLVIINNIKTNIGSFLIHNFKIEKSENNFYRRCHNSSCFICKFSLNFNFIRFKNFLLPIQSTSSCDSIGIVYIIFCSSCKCFYIGESKRSALERISEHVKNIMKFKNNIISSLMNYNKISEVALHFNSKKHCIEKHFKFFIFESNLINDEIRKSIETDIINIFENCNLKIINLKKPNIFTCNYLTFQK